MAGSRRQAISCSQLLEGATPNQGSVEFGTTTLPDQVPEPEIRGPVPWSDVVTDAFAIGSRGGSSTTLSSHSSRCGSSSGITPLRGRSRPPRARWLLLVLGTLLGAVLTYFVTQSMFGTAE